MHKIISGDIFQDSRGSIKFFNDFDMESVKRFYIIRNSKLSPIRGWRAHKIEQRWFYVLNGSFIISLVKIDDWVFTSKDLDIEHYNLKFGENNILHIPAGYAVAINALEENSELLVFADHYLEHAKHDNYTYDLNYFANFFV